MLTKYINVFAGSYVSCGIVETGAAKCWGYNSYGQIGIGITSFSVLNPTFVDPGMGYQSLSPNQSGRNFGVTTTGILKGWGEYSYLGNGLTPVFTPGSELP